MEERIVVFSKNKEEAQKYLKEIILEENASMDIDLSLDRLKDTSGRVGIVVDGEIVFRRENV